MVIYVYNLCTVGSILFESSAQPKSGILFSLALMFISYAGSASGYAATVLVYEYEEEIPEAAPIAELNSFEEVAETAKARAVPILVEFSTPWCRYCKTLEEQVLKPLMRSGTLNNI